MPRVLIVDNEGPIRTMLADVLRGSGYNVSVARSGFEAIEIALAVVPDVVMLDVNMPGFDGWATLEHLRAARPETRVLMMSGSDHAAQAMARGAVAFLDKPYFPADVLRVVAHALDEQPDRPSRSAA
ncbi:MAG: response regulator [Dehalococcoidia bacterium]